MTSKQTTHIRQVNCPSCQRIVRWTEEEKFRPFCSKKCQLLDFGAWASENYSIPTGTVETDTEIDQDEESWSRE
jgi:endogenous inhibitor of DNA gyrase (YacG/DUF329 family)